ncbi:MAG: tetratricopeptide repeat protein [Elusimicrobiaceae bacterium]|nr:tetratricopeptide repeat protein [Elusimicrobiaceae bacterium]
MAEKKKKKITKKTTAKKPAVKKATKKTKVAKPKKVEQVKATPIEKIPPQKPALDFGDGIIGQVITFVKTNLKITVASIIGLILVISLFNLIGNSQQKQTEKSWKKLFQAKQQYFMQEDGSNKQAYKKIEKLCKKYPRSEACLYGNIFKASMLIHNDADAKGSIEVLNEVLQNNKLDNEKTKPLLILMLTAAYQTDGNSEKSLELATNFVEKYPTHYGLPQAILLKAQSHLAVQQMEEAIASYQVIKENYPNSYWEIIATFEMDQLIK